MLSNQIRILRKINKFTQSDLATHLNITQQAVAKWEKGVSEPDSASLIKLADLFGVTTDYLLGRDTSVSSSVPALDTLSPADCALLAAYHAAPPEIQNIVHTALAPYKTQNPAASENAAGGYM